MERKPSCAASARSRRRHVVLEVDEGLAAPAAGSRGARPAPRARASRRRTSKRCAVPGEPAGLRRGEARGRAVRERGGEPVHAAAGARGALALRRLRRHESARGVAPGEPPARLREEVHRRHPAAGHQHEVAGERRGRRSSTPRDAPAAARAVHGGAREDRDTGTLAPRLPTGSRPRAAGPRSPRSRRPRRAGRAPRGSAASVAVTSDRARPGAHAVALR